MSRIRDIANILSGVSTDMATDAEVTSSIASHAAAADPHTGYLKESEFQAAGKNYLINGAFDFWQRGTTFVDTNQSNKYTADRWGAVRGGWASGQRTERITLDKSEISIPATYGIRISRIQGNTSTVAYSIAQCLEEHMASSLAGQTVTFSFYARKSAAYTGASIILTLLTGTLQFGPGDGVTNLVANEVYLTPTTSWARYSITATIGNNVKGLSVSINATCQGTAPANEYLDITGAQLELGSVPTQFARAGGNLATELILCQRYYSKSYNVDTVPGTDTNEGIVYSGFTPATTTGYISCPVSFPVTMRSAPSFLTYDVVETSGRVSRATPTFSDQNGVIPSLVFNSQSSILVQSPSGNAHSGLAFHWVANAEV